MAWLEEMGCWKWTLRFSKPTPDPVSASVSLCLSLSLPAAADQDAKLSVMAPVPHLPEFCHAPHHDINGLSPWNCKQVSN